MNNWQWLALAVGVWFVLVVIFEAYRMRHDDDE